MGETVRGLFACQAEQRNLRPGVRRSRLEKGAGGNTLSGFVCLQVSAGRRDQGADIHSPLVYSGLSFFLELCNFLGVTGNKAMLALNAAPAVGRLLRWNVLLQRGGTMVEALQPHLIVTITQKHQVGSTFRTTFILHGRDPK